MSAPPMKTDKLTLPLKIQSNNMFALIGRANEKIPSKIIKTIKDKPRGILHTAGFLRISLRSFTQIYVIQRYIPPLML